MRAGLLVLSAVVLAGLLWYLLRDPPPTPEEAPYPTTGEAGVGDGPASRITTGTLIVRVQGPDGSAPPGAEVGYVHDDRPRFVYADEAGRHTFTDAPLGPLHVVGRAPGYEVATQPRTILRGVPTTVLLTLTPRHD